MKRKIFVFLIGCILAFAFVGCGETTVLNVNVENSSELNNTTLGTDALIEIGNGLWYDSTTRIVYWWNGCLGYGSILKLKSGSDTTPSPYYAPNGLPYKYNPETNTFEEINENNT